MEKQYEFRPATSADIAAILALYDSAKGSAFSVWDADYPGLAEVEADLAAGTLHVLTEGGAVIGSASLEPRNDMDDQPCWTVRENTRELARVVLADTHRGKGLAKRLVLEMETVLRAQGVAAIHLSAAKKNLPARKTYAALGFTPQAEAFLYGHDYILLEKVLG